jgi:hypothetical protein
LNPLIETASAAGTPIGFPGGKHDVISQDRLALRAPDSDIQKYIPDEKEKNRTVQQNLERPGLKIFLGKCQYRHCGKTNGHEDQIHIFPLIQSVSCSHNILIHVYYTLRIKEDPDGL